MLHKHADYEAWTATVFNTELNAWVKHTGSEANQTLQEGRALRDIAIEKHQKALKDLNFSKDKLFATGDYTKWGVVDSSMSLLDLANLKYDKEKAFTFMLPNVILYQLANISLQVTKDVEKLREEAEYFTNQVYREYKRISAINYEMARTLTTNIGEMLLRLTYTVSNGW